MDPDVLVVGGGMAGLFCAYFLRRRGYAVTVVERGRIGGPQSCSSGNTGFVGTQGSAPLPEPGLLTPRRLLDPDGPLYVRPRLDPDLLRWLAAFRRACDERAAEAGFRVLVRLKRRSLELLRAVCATGELAESFTQKGIVLAYRTPEALRRAELGVPRAVAGGVPLRVLTRDELRELEPGTRFDISGALYNEEGAALRVPGFIVAFARKLTDMGVEIRPDTEVTGFRVKGRTVAEVMTGRGAVRPGEIVIAAGSWSAACARDLDISLDLQPVKGYAITVRRPSGAPRRPLVLGEDRIAVLPSGDRVRYAGRLELPGRDTRVPRWRVNGMVETVRRYLPGLRRPEILKTWSGLRPCTPDGLPVTGRAGGYGNLVITCGHGPIGMGLTPAGGELVAQIIGGEAAADDIHPLRAGRFSRGGRP